MKTIEELRAELVAAEVKAWETADDTWYMARGETKRIKDEIKKLEILGQDNE